MSIRDARGRNLNCFVSACAAFQFATDSEWWTGWYRTIELIPTIAWRRTTSPAKSNTKCEDKIYTKEPYCAMSSSSFCRLEQTALIMIRARDCYSHMSVISNLHCFRVIGHVLDPGSLPFLDCRGQSIMQMEYVGSHKFRLHTVRRIRVFHIVILCD